MPIYIGDYLSDTAMLSTEQHGAFLLMLMAYWKNGPLPDDDEVLANITRLPIERWQKTRGLLLGFFSVSGGFWINKRSDEEKAKANAFFERQRTNGSKGGRPKKPNQTQNKPVGLPNHNPNETPSQSQSPNKDIPPNPQGGDGGHKRQRRKDETPYHEIVEAYREALPDLPQPTGPENWTEQRRRTVRALWDESPERQSIEWWQRFFGYVARSAFLTGKTPQAFEASFDWLLKPGNLTKVLEGNYHKVLNHG